MRVFKLPEFPASLSLQSIQRFYNELILQLGKAIFCVPPENSALLARYTTTPCPDMRTFGPFQPLLDPLALILVGSGVLVIGLM